MLKDNEEYGNYRTNLHFELNSMLIGVLKKHDHKDTMLVSLEHGAFISALDKVADKNDVSILSSVFDDLFNHQFKLTRKQVLNSDIDKDHEIRIRELLTGKENVKLPEKCGQTVESALK